MTPACRWNCINVGLCCLSLMHVKFHKTGEISLISCDPFSISTQLEKVEFGFPHVLYFFPWTLHIQLSTFYLIRNMIYPVYVCYFSWLKAHGPCIIFFLNTVFSQDGLFCVNVCNYTWHALHPVNFYIIRFVMNCGANRCSLLVSS